MHIRHIKFFSWCPLKYLALAGTKDISQTYSIFIYQEIFTATSTYKRNTNSHSNSRQYYVRIRLRYKGIYCVDLYVCVCVYVCIFVKPQREISYDNESVFLGMRVGAHYAH